MEGLVKPAEVISHPGSATMSATLGEIAEVVEAELVGDAGTVIEGVATIQSAGEKQLTFLSNRRYYSYLAETSAAAVLLGAEDLASCPTAALIVKDPYLGFVKAVRYLNPEPQFIPKVHENAVVDPSVSVPADCYIGPGSVLEAGVKLSSQVYIGPGCCIGENTSIGAHTKLHASIVLSHEVILGERNIIHPGVVIGADGFGIANDAGAWLKIPQLGTVILGDDVEVGANTTIDRGALENTQIDDGVKIDNQVQIGHNVHIGAHTAIAGNVGIAGSATIGKYCMIGGGSSINGHIQIADKVVITGMSGVSNSIKEAGVYSAGLPVTDNLLWRKNIVRFKQLDQLARRLANVENSIADDKDNE